MQQVVLVLDAEPIVRTVITRILKRAGYLVFATGDLPEAATLVKEHQPDLLLTNVVVPGTTGREAAKSLRAVCPGMRALMVAGIPDDSEASDAVIEHMDLFPKPFTADELIHKVQEVLPRAS